MRFLVDAYLTGHLVVFLPVGICVTNRQKVLKTYLKSYGFEKLERWPQKITVKRGKGPKRKY